MAIGGGGRGSGDEPVLFFFFFFPFRRWQLLTFGRKRQSGRPSPCDVPLCASSGLLPAQVATFRAAFATLRSEWV